MITHLMAFFAGILLGILLTALISAAVDKRVEDEEQLEWLEHLKEEHNDQKTEANDNEGTDETEGIQQNQ